MSDGRSGLFCVFFEISISETISLKGSDRYRSPRTFDFPWASNSVQATVSWASRRSFYSARLRFSLLCDFIDQLIDFGRDRHERNGSTFTSNQLWQCSSIGKRDWAEENFDEFHLGSPINETRWEEESNDPTKIGEYSHHLFLPTSQLYGPIRFTRYALN